VPVQISVSNEILTYYNLKQLGKKFNPLKNSQFFSTPFNPVGASEITTENVDFPLDLITL
jgi:hypothetical protein